MFYFSRPKRILYLGVQYQKPSIIHPRKLRRSVPNRLYRSLKSFCIFCQSSATWDILQCVTGTQCLIFAFCSSSVLTFTTLFQFWIEVNQKADILKEKVSDYLTVCMIQVSTHSHIGLQISIKKGLWNVLSPRELNRLTLEYFFNCLTYF